VDCPAVAIAMLATLLSMYMIYFKRNMFLKKNEAGWISLSGRTRHPKFVLATKLVSRVCKGQEMCFYHPEHTDIKKNSDKPTRLPGRCCTESSTGGVLRIGTMKYGLEFRGTQTRAGLRWRSPAAIVNYRPVLSSERALLNNKPATV
jgi:hypothetical protein